LEPRGGKRKGFPTCSVNQQQVVESADMNTAKAQERGRSIRKKKLSSIVARSHTGKAKKEGPRPSRGRFGGGWEKEFPSCKATRGLKKIIRPTTGHNKKKEGLGDDTQIFTLVKLGSESNDGPVDRGFGSFLE